MHSFLYWTVFWIIALRSNLKIWDLKADFALKAPSLAINGSCCSMLFSVLSSLEIYHSARKPLISSLQIGRLAMISYHGALNFAHSCWQCLNFVATTCKKISLYKSLVDQPLQPTSTKISMKDSKNPSPEILQQTHKGTMN